MLPRYKRQIAKKMEEKQVGEKTGRENLTYKTGYFLYCGLDFIPTGVGMGLLFFQCS